MMISPDEFYTIDDNPSDKIRQHAWKAIKKAVAPVREGVFFSFDRKSFLVGAVASFVVLFASVGIYSTIRNFVDSSKPQSIRLDSAYESAIQQFERFVPAAGTVTADRKNIVSTRKEQLQYLDAAIQEMKKEMNGSDVSPLKRSRLRQLYGMKLGILQEMIEQGEIEL